MANVNVHVKLVVGSVLLLMLFGCLANDFWRIVSFYSQSSALKGFTVVAIDTCHSQLLARSSALCQ